MKDQATDARVERAVREPLTGRWLAPALLALSIGFGVFLLYFLAYPTRHLSFPMGFDPPYYVWRAQYLASQGLGTGETAARPGYPILSVLIASLTGLSQLKLLPVLSLALVSLLALAVGTFAAAGLGTNRTGWALTVAVAGIVVGPTHLVGENLSNTLNLTFEVAALGMLAWGIGRGEGRSFWAGVALLVAAGLAHWDFLVPLGAVLIVAMVLAIPISRQQSAMGLPLVRTDAGLLAGAGIVVAGITSVLVGVVLRAPAVTIEVGQDRVLYWKKFTRDLGRVFVPTGAALLGGWTQSARPHGRDDRRRAFAGRALAAWTGVMTAGIVFGALTLKLPPARFLALLVAFPGAVVTARGVGLLLRWVRGNLPASITRVRAAAAGGAALLVVLAALAVPSVLRWYRYPVLMEQRAVRQAEVAGTYVATLPRHQPVIFLVDYYVRPFPYGSVLAERIIRIALPADRQPDVYIFVGSVTDLMAGRRTPPPNDRLRITTTRFWEEVRDVLPAEPPVLVLRDLSGTGFDRARELEARAVGPGVEVLRALPQKEPVVILSPVRSDGAGAEGVVWGAVILLLLGVAGAGWTCMFLPPAANAEAFFSVAPVVGAAAIVIGGLVADRVGVRLDGASGVLTYVAVTLSGAVGAAWPSPLRAAKRSG